MDSEAPPIEHDERVRVCVERDDWRAMVTLDSPHNRNALSASLVTQLDAALADVLGDRRIRVVTLTATGPVFCAGADLKRGPRRPGANHEFLSVLRRLRTSPKPVVCRLNGPARAGGVGLMAACHLVVAPSSCTFAFTEVRIGVAPAVIAVPVLARVPFVAARRLFLTGRPFDAAHAAAIGLVDDAVPDDELDDTCERYVSDLALGGPEAIATTMQLLVDVRELPEDQALDRMGRLSAERFGSAESHEGIAAWRERRPPDWAPSTSPSTP